MKNCFGCARGVQPMNFFTRSRRNEDIDTKNAKNGRRTTKLRGREENGSEVRRTRPVYPTGSKQTRLEVGDDEQCSLKRRHLASPNLK